MIIWIPRFMTVTTMEIMIEITVLSSSLFMKDIAKFIANENAIKNKLTNQIEIRRICFLKYGNPTFSHFISSGSGAL